MKMFAGKSLLEGKEPFTSISSGLRQKDASVILSRLAGLGVSKPWPVDQIYPVPCFCTASELIINGFHIFKGLKTNQKMNHF